MDNTQYSPCFYRQYIIYVLWIPFYWDHNIPLENPCNFERLSNKKKSKYLSSTLNTWLCLRFQVHCQIYVINCTRSEQKRVYIFDMYNTRIEQKTDQVYRYQNGTIPKLSEMMGCFIAHSVAVCLARPICTLRSIMTPNAIGTNETTTATV